MLSEPTRSIPRTRIIWFEVKRWFCWIRVQDVWWKWPSFKEVSTKPSKPRNMWSFLLKPEPWLRSPTRVSLRCFVKSQVWQERERWQRKNFSKPTIWLSFASRPIAHLGGWTIRTISMWPSLRKSMPLWKQSRPTTPKAIHSWSLSDL